MQDMSNAHPRIRDNSSQAKKNTTPPFLNIIIFNKIKLNNNKYLKIFFRNNIAAELTKLFAFQDYTAKLSDFGLAKEGP
jgi:hypothetical protein